MKTIEEKAKAYDEAIKRAKDFEKGEVHFALKPGESIVHWIFPELRESEDERIKKIITDSVFYQYGAGVEYKDVLDYLDKLEKQKEPSDPEDRMNHPLYLEGFDVGRKVGQVEAEQKPAWSEEDEKEYNYIMSYLDTAPKGKQNHAAKWLKKRRSCSSWKPSDEQMKRLADAVESWRGGIGYNELKSLYNDLQTKL